MLLGYSVLLALIAGRAIGFYSTSQTVSKDLQEALQAVEAARMSDYIELRVSEMGRQSRGYGPLTKNPSNATPWVSRS
jgi:hypothetical protein